MDKWIGYALIIVGIVILVLVLLMGYGIYLSASGTANDLTLFSTGGSNQSVNSSVSSLSKGLNLTAQMGLYTGIEIAVLFLFASIAYKLVYLGVQIKNGEARQEQKKLKD